MAIQGMKIKLWRVSWLVGVGLLMPLWGNVSPVLAQHVICCMRLIDVKGNWFGALRTCDLSNLPPEQRAKICQEFAGCADTAPYCGVDRPCTETGSLIDIQNQALGERIAVSGTPFSLYYRSDRMRGGRAGDSFPNSLGGWSLSDHFGYETQRGILYNGDGKRRIAKATGVLAGVETRIPSEEGAFVYVFDAKGRHLRTANGLTGALHQRFFYDKAGGLIEIEDAYGNITRVERDGKSVPKAIIAPGGQRTALTTNPGGYLTSVTNPAGETIRLTYSGEGVLASLTDPKGQVYNFTYSKQGNLLKDENPAGGHWTLAKKQTGNRSSVALSSALGRTSVYEIDRLATGEERRINTGSGGAAIRVEKDKQGNTGVFHPDGTVSTAGFQPDPRWGALAPYLKTFSLATPGGRQLSVTVERKANLAQPNNPLTLRSLTETIMVNSRRYTSVFDPGDKQSIRETPGGRRVITESDQYGRVVRQEIVGLLPIRFEYDDKGRLSQVTQGAEDYARTATLNYDGEGRITAATDPLKRKTRFEYDPAGRITKQIFADGREILFAYDGNGNVISVTPPGKTAHAFDYTPLDQSRSYLPPAVGSQNHSTAYVYNRDKQLIRVTRPDGKNIEVEYDKAGRVSSIAAPHGKTRYLFDAKTDQLKTITAADGGTLSYAYDGFLFASLNWNGAIKGSVARAHDDDLRISSITVNGKRMIENRYDADGMLIQAGALTLERFQRSGLITGTKVGNVKTLDEYNSFAEISRFTASFGDKEILAIDYERDGAGRIVKKIETIEGRSRTVAYAYDLAGRLTRVLTDGAQETRYEYDANGNRIAYRGTTGDAKGSYDAQDRLLNYGAVSHRYTANGELASKGSGGKNTAFDYDAFGSLRSATIAGGSKIEYVIDGVNRRIGKKLEGKLVQGFLYGDQLKPVAELDARNNVVSTFSYATRINVPDYLEKSDGLYRIITDHLGSPRLVVNVETGAIAQRMDYDEFGNVVQDTNPGFQPFGFAGGLYDQHTKLTRFGARDYDASVGRWTTKDPLRFRAGAMNFYQYASNDPINFADPTGLDEEAGIMDRLIGASDAASQVGRDGSVYHWSEGGHAGNRSQGMQYSANGFGISPNPNGGRFDASGGISGPIGPGTGSLNFTAEGTFGPDGTTARFGGRAEYNIPLGWGFDFRGEAWGNGDSSGEGRWGGGASTGWGRGRWACRVGVGVGGDFSGDVTVAPTIEIPF